jgi:hypothetical protein
MNAGSAHQQAITGMARGMRVLFGADMSLQADPNVSSII